MKKWVFICASCFLGLSMSPTGFAQQGQKVTVSEILGKGRNAILMMTRPANYR